jgi:hypothetical protein
MRLPLLMRAREASDSASPWKVIRLWFPWQPQEYARTCAECGYIWRVPRWAAQRRVRSISMISAASRRTIDRGELTRRSSQPPAPVSRLTPSGTARSAAQIPSRRAHRGEFRE